MDIKEQFNLVAQEYDANRRRFIPCFDDYYDNTTQFVLSCLHPPRRVLDLGAGTGLLTYYWYQHCPTADYVLVDIADEMLNVARRRFAGLDSVSYQALDYTQTLPSGDFDAMISALSIHHLEHADKQRLFARIYDRLPRGGVFVNYDQFCAGQEEISRWFDAYWEDQLLHSGLSEHDIALWRERRKLDRECSVEAELDMLRQSGFAASSCVYASQKFAVIMAVKT